MPNIQKNTWEFLDLKNTKIPADIRNSNDAEVIRKWSEEHRTELTEQEWQALSHRQESCRKLSRKIAEVKQAVSNNIYWEKKADALILEDAQMYVLNDIEQPSFQTADNGCWSCFYQMALQSRGIKDLTQEDIRAFRPQLTDGKRFTEDSDQELNSDVKTNMIDMADLALDLMPDTMVKSTEIWSYNKFKGNAPDDPMAKVQYFSAVETAVKEQIIRAIRDHHSPVGLMMDGHYITITGIEGNHVYYKNPMPSEEAAENPDHTYTATLSDLLDKALNGVNADAVSLTWLEDIKLDKDNMSIYDTANPNTKVKENGEIEVQALEDQTVFADDRHQNGLVIGCTGGLDLADRDAKYRSHLQDGFFQIDKTYLPKSVNLQSLRKKAESRSNEEESILRARRDKVLADRKMLMDQIALENEGQDVQAQMQDPQSVQQGQNNVPGQNIPQSLNAPGGIREADKPQNDRFTVRVQFTNRPFYGGGNFVDFKDSVSAVGWDKNKYGTLLGAIANLYNIFPVEPGSEQKAAVDGQFTEFFDLRGENSVGSVTELKSKLTTFYDRMREGGRFADAEGKQVTLKGFKEADLLSEEQRQAVQYLESYIRTLAEIEKLAPELDMELIDADRFIDPAGQIHTEEIKADEMIQMAVEANVPVQDNGQPLRPGYADEGGLELRIVPDAGEEGFVQFYGFLEDKGFPFTYTNAETNILRAVYNLTKAGGEAYHDLYQAMAGQPAIDQGTLQQWALSLYDLNAAGYLTDPGLIDSATCVTDWLGMREKEILKPLQEAYAKGDAKVYAQELLKWQRSDLRSQHKRGYIVHYNDKVEETLKGYQEEFANITPQNAKYAFYREVYRELAVAAEQLGTKVAVGKEGRFFKEFIETNAFFDESPRVEIRSNERWKNYVIGEAAMAKFRGSRDFEADLARQAIDAILKRAPQSMQAIGGQVSEMYRSTLTDEDKALYDIGAGIETRSKEAQVWLGVNDITLDYDKNRDVVHIDIPTHLADPGAAAGNQANDNELDIEELNRRAINQALEADQKTVDTGVAGFWDGDADVEGIGEDAEYLFADEEEKELDLSDLKRNLEGEAEPHFVDSNEVEDDDFNLIHEEPEIKKEEPRQEEKDQKGNGFSLFEEEGVEEEKVQEDIKEEPRQEEMDQKGNGFSLFEEEEVEEEKVQEGVKEEKVQEDVKEEVEEEIREEIKAEPQIRQVHEVQFEQPADPKAQKREYLIKAMANDLDAGEFADDVVYNNIRWNPDGQNTMLDEIVSEYYGVGTKYYQDEAQVRLFDAFLDELATGTQEADLLHDILENFSAIRIWENRNKIREALIGERFIPTDCTDEELEKHQKAIADARIELTQTVIQLKQEQIMDQADEPKEVDRVQAAPEKNFVIADPNGTFTITRVPIRNGEDPFDLLRKFARENTPAQIRRDCLLSYIYADYDDEEFEFEIKRIQGSEAVQNVVTELTQYAGIDFLSSKANQEKLIAALQNGAEDEQALDWVKQEIRMMKEQALQNEQEMQELREKLRQQEENKEEQELKENQEPEKNQNLEENQEFKENQDFEGNQNLEENQEFKGNQDFEENQEPEKNQNLKENQKPENEKEIVKENVKDNPGNEQQQFGQVDAPENNQEGEKENQNMPHQDEHKNVQKEEKEPRQYSDLFRLSDQDFAAIGCTQEELARVKDLNVQLDELNRQLKGKMEITAKERTQKRILQESLYNVFLKAADRTPERWEYAPSKLPAWVRATGSVAAQDQILRVYGESLPLVDKVRMLKRRQITLKARSLAKSQEKGEHTKRYEVISNHQNAASLTGIHQTGFQTGAQGCWAASTELLLKSRGIENVTQNDVRNFRPDCKGEDMRDRLSVDVKKQNMMDVEDLENMENDKSNSVMERAEAFVSLAPGSMLQGIQIEGYSNEVRRMGVTREEYLRRTKAIVASHILHAIKEEKSPVSFLAGGHYITITGIDEKGVVTYKDSQNKHNGKGPDVDHKTTLDQLLGRIAYTSIHMEWAADLKLSQDGRQLYNVPSEYLTVGDDGEIYMPDTLSDGANSANTFQHYNGTYIRRNNYSEGPDADANREQNLKNGGVNVSQIVYLPKKVNVELLKKQAGERTPEEEQRLKEMTEQFYRVKPRENVFQTKEEVNSAYKLIETPYNLSRVAAQEQGAARIMEKINAAAVNPPAQAPATSDSGKYDAFINTSCRKALAPDMFADGKRKYVAFAAAAAIMKAEGASFDKEEIKQLGNRLYQKTDIANLSFGQLNQILTDQNRMATFDAIRQDALEQVYQTKPDYREGYIREMKQLAENMMTKEGRSTKYQNLYDAIQDAAKIDINAENAGEQLIAANRKIMQCVRIYVDGKEKVRFWEDGKKRFDNAIDAASIVAAYAPKSAEVDADRLVSKINQARGVSRKKYDPDRVDLKNYGGERAKNRVVKENQKKQEEQAQKNVKGTEKKVKSGPNV